MIRSRQSIFQLNKYVIAAVLAAVLMIAGAIGWQHDRVAAITCNTVLTDWTSGSPKNAYYYNPGFFDGRCVDGNRNFPNTGRPYSTDGNVDSVGYVIPRTYKAADYRSEALADVNTKDQFYDKLRYHYFNRVVAGSQEGYWAKDGAAFVVFSFIGKNPPADRNLSSADWADFKQRLDNPNLTMSIDNNYKLSPNSGAVYDTTGRLDFTRFYDEMGLRGPSLIFKIGGIEVASIERKCANLLGSVVLPEANQWTIRGESYVDNMSDAPGRQNGDPQADPVVSARPGQALEWDHDLRNDSTYDMDRNIAYHVDRNGFANGWDASKEKSGTGSGVANELFVNLTAPSSEKSRYVVQPSDGGRKLCQRITWNDGAWDDTGDRSSDWACAAVPYNFNLIPSVSGVSGIRTVGAPIDNINPSVLNELPGNASQTTNSSNVDWLVTRIEVAPGGTIKTAIEENNTAPCLHYGNTCDPKTNGNEVFQADVTNVTAPLGETVSADALPGTKICYALSVKPYSQANNEWRHGIPACITVGKQPKVQVLGHDLRTRGKISTGVTSTTNKTFGSWVEYGGFSVGPNSGFASASGLSNGNDSPTPNDWHKLTFANVNSGGGSSYGNFTLPSLPAITSQFIGTPGGAPSSDLGSLGSGTYQTDDFIINDTSTIGQSDGIGKSIIIVSTGTVTIKKNITYSAPGPGDTFSNPQELPQVVIIAQNINIENDVTQIDAWLLTTGDGSINTCSDVQPVTSALNSKVCDNTLTVNGAVATQHLYLRRTAGSDTVPTAGSPAEVFNLRPDAFMWAYARASQAGKAQTVYSVELPPRF